jgi:hypothetical protein
MPVAQDPAGNWFDPRGTEDKWAATHWSTVAASRMFARACSSSNKYATSCTLGNSGGSLRGVKRVAT